MPVVVPQTASVPVVHPTEDAQQRHRRILRSLTGLLLGMFVSMIANTVVSTSLPVIVHDIGGTQASYTWVVTAMLLSTAIATPIWGKLADLFDRKLLFQIAIVGFVLASASAGFSHSPEFLICCRVFQGLFGGGMIALSQVIMADLMSPRERGRYMGLFGAVMAVATVGGPLAGGLITDAFGWRWNFLVSVPFALIALVMVQRTLRLAPMQPRRAHIDVLGILLLAVATSLVLLWITNAGTEYDWLSPTTAWMLGGALVAAVLFVVVERRHPEPLLPLHLFADRTVTLAVIASIAVGVAMFGSSVYLAQYMQLARGATPTHAGLMTIPLMAGFLITSTLVGRRITKHGSWKPYLVGGAVSLIAGTALLSTLHYDTPFALVCLYMALVGVGMGSTMQNLVLVVQNAVAPQHLGVASSAVTFFRSLGGTAGVSAMGAAVATTVGTGMTERAGDLRRALASLGADGPRWAESLQSGTLPAVAAMPEPLRVIVEDVYAQSISQAFLITVPLAVVSLLAILFLPNVSLGQRSGEELRAESSAPGSAPTGTERRDDPERRHA